MLVDSPGHPSAPGDVQVRACATVLHHAPRARQVGSTTLPILVLLMATITDGEAPAPCCAIAVGVVCLAVVPGRSAARRSEQKDLAGTTPDNMFEVNVVDVSPPAQTFVRLQRRARRNQRPARWRRSRVLTEPAPPTPPDHQPAPWSGN